MQLRISATMLVGVATFCGCAYFNGLYNANRLAGAALRAEREGRVGDARSLWSQAAVKAESVAVRYVDSKYQDDALTLQGRALRAAGQCRLAIEPLKAVVENSRDHALVEQAHYHLGRCYYSYGYPDSAITSFTGALLSGDTLLVSAAHLWRGRSFALKGAYEAAILDLNASAVVDAAFDLAVAHSHLGQRVRAEGVLRWRADGEYNETKWLATLDSVGSRQPELSSTIAELLLDHPDVDAEEKGRLLLQDGDRWAGRGAVGRARARFEQVLTVAPETAVSEAARFRLIVADVQSSTNLGLLPDWLDSLSGMSEVVVPTPPSFADLFGTVEMVAFSLEYTGDEERESDSWRSQHPDLEMFLAAEALRDRVDARPLACSLFQELVARFPDSPVAPKALLAAAALDTVSGQRLVYRVLRTYPQSPYTLVMAGTGQAAYAALEDSLRTLILGRQGAT